MSNSTCATYATHPLENRLPQALLRPPGRLVAGDQRLRLLLVGREAEPPPVRRLLLCALGLLHLGWVGVGFTWRWGGVLWCYWSGRLPCLTSATRREEEEERAAVLPVFDRKMHIESV